MATKIILHLTDENNKLVPKIALQAGKMWTMKIVDVKPEDRYEEIHVHAQLVGCRY